jgi:hypothetical protein
MKSEKLEVARGSGNVFRDLGHENDGGGILPSHLLGKCPHFGVQGLGLVGRSLQVQLAGGGFHAHLHVVLQEAADLAAIRLGQPTMQDSISRAHKM